MDGTFYKGLAVGGTEHGTYVYSMGQIVVLSVDGGLVRYTIAEVSSKQLGGSILVFLAGDLLDRLDGDPSGVLEEIKDAQQKVRVR